MPWDPTPADTSDTSTLPPWFWDDSKTTSYSVTHTTTSTTSTSPVLRRFRRFTMSPLPDYYEGCAEFNLCLRQCDFYQTECTLSAQYFAHCPEFGFCKSDDFNDEGKDIINEVISTNTKQLSTYVESTKTDKRSFESIKSGFTLQLDANYDMASLKPKLLSTATEAYRTAYNSSLVSVQIVSFQISNHSDFVAGELDDSVEVEEKLQRKRRNDNIEDTIEAILIIFAKLTVGLNGESSLDISSDFEAIDFVKSAKIIPPSTDNLSYFIIQMVVLGITIIIFISSTVRRKQLSVPEKAEEKSSEPLQKDSVEQSVELKHHEDGLQFFMVVLIHFFLPILSIYPSVYIWYDYQTNQKLAFSPQDRKFAALLFSFFILKLLSFIWKCFILNKVIQDPHFIKRNRKLYRVRYIDNVDSTFYTNAQLVK